MLMIFFFQAEDGIRDLVRSRGLGDVYKRQIWRWNKNNGFANNAKFRNRQCPSSRDNNISRSISHIHTPVSYTHLTLPTSDLV